MSASIDSTWLRCPNCFGDLDPVADATFGCAAGHRFDVNRRGILTLLPPRAPRTVGDDRSMLEDRRRLLDSGLYDGIVDAVVDAAASHAGGAGVDGIRVADLGCGTGHYGAAVARRLDASTVLMADRSPDAVRAARRTVPGSTGVVLDLWRPLPLRDRAADVALNVFAPRNPEEFHRVLSPRGALVVVVPTARHLRELRARGRMLDVPEGKADEVRSRMEATGLLARSERRVETLLAASDEVADLIIGMGPSAHHRGGNGRADARAEGDDVSAARSGGAATSTEITLSVDVLLFTP